MPQMNKFFVDWYRVVDPEPHEDKLRRRWDGIVNYSKRKKLLDNAINLIRLFYNIPLLDNTFEDGFAEAFQKTDNSFSIREKKGSIELRVLAGATLIYLIENKEAPVSTAIALAVVCCYVDGLRDDIPILDLLSISKNYVNEQSLDSRMRRELPDIDFSSLRQESHLAEIGDYEKLGNIPSLSQSITDTLSEIINLTMSHFEDLANSIEILEKQVKFQEEETNILWWLFSETSRGIGKPFSGIDLPLACALAAKELDSLIVTLPGPKASYDFLARVISKAKGDLGKKIAIKDFINELPRDIRKNLIANSGGHTRDDICPLNCAIMKSIEIEGENSWVSAFEYCAKINASSSLLPLDLCFQLYQEESLIRILALCDN